MSLHTLANHMAARGRGPDSTLVHMSPREVQGLQALAKTQGQSLTINPQTGLPEAGILENLLPALAGFALDAFAPGVGSTIGGMLGLEGTAASTVGTGLLVGGATGLVSGSLEKGLMAGLGGAGGAGLAESAYGASAAGKAAASGAADVAAAKSPMGTFDRLSSMKEGAGNLFSAPKDALKDNMFNLGLAGLPLLTGAFDSQSSSAAKPSYGNIRRFKTDPVTGRSYQYEVIPAEDFGNRSAIEWGGVPAAQRAANGGLMQHYDTGGITTWGKIPSPSYKIPDTPDLRSDSQKAQDYLMGGKNPFLFKHGVATDPLVEKAKEAANPTTNAISNAAAAAAAAEEAARAQWDNRGGSGKGGAPDPTGGGNDSWNQMSELQKSQWYENHPDAWQTKLTGMLGGIKPGLTVPNEPKQGAYLPLDPAQKVATANQEAQDLMMRQLAEQAQAEAQARFDAQLERQTALEKAIADQKAAEQINTGPQALDPAQKAQAAAEAAASLNVGSTFNDMYKPTPTAGSYIPGESVVAPAYVNPLTGGSELPTRPGQETSGAPAPSAPVASTTPGFLVDKFNNPVTSPVSGIFNTPNTPVGEANTAGLVYGGEKRGWYAPVNKGGSESESGLNGTSDPSGLGGTVYGRVDPTYRGGSEAAKGGLLRSHYARGGIAALASGGMNYDQTDPYVVSLQQKAALGPTDPAKIESLRKLVEAGKKPEELPLDPKDPYYSSIIEYLYGSAPNSSLPAWGNVGGSAGLAQREIAADPNAWQNQTPEQKAAYFADHPGMAGIQNAVLTGWGMTLPGIIQNKFDPGQMQRERGILERAKEISEAKTMGPPISAMGMSPETSQEVGNTFNEMYRTPQQVSDSGVDGGESFANRYAEATRDGGEGGEGGEGGGEGHSTAAYGGMSSPHGFKRYAYGGIAALANGGYNLGSYSDGGRLLRGPGDGVSDDIPATIGHNQPARLADGEFVVPARIVSELGNGSTEAGARKLYAMMDRVQKARGKTVGKNKIAANSRADKYLPA